MIERNSYLNQLLDWKDKNIIKVLTGIRRCGKSTILKQFQSYLMNHGVVENQIISINFEERNLMNFWIIRSCINTLKSEW